MRRLYLKIYLAFLAVVFLSVVVTTFSARLLMETFGEVDPPLQTAIGYLAADLPPIGTATGELDTAIREVSAQLSVEMSIWTSEGRLLSATNSQLPGPDIENPRSRWFHNRHTTGAVVQLDDGRWLTVGVAPSHVRAHGHFKLLLVLLLTVAIGCYPIARQITRRLEVLQRGVEDWGAGELSTRVEVEGRDEVAELARSFNESAQRIETLVEQQKRVLANASHELRSPLARLRMALELIDESSDEAERERLHAAAAIDITELDELIGEVLLASRLERNRELEQPEPCELSALLEPECLAVGAEMSGERVQVKGNRAMLCRMFRNLLENGSRYGEEVTATVEKRDDRAVVVVADRGPGVPEEERERIFERFYRRDSHSEGAHGGVGLGLSLVRQIAQLHGGDVQYKPRDGGGSQFEVDLPLFERDQNRE